MPESRTPLQSLPVFSGPSSYNRKRRYTGDTFAIEFFTPSASTFRPRPYSQVNRDRHDKPFNARHLRNVDTLALNPKGMEPDPSDPGVLVIHPPFTSFPDSQHSPEGLTYQILTENIEWFLDPSDFISSSSNNPTAIPYPPSLEPPRGWCPAKKKDLKNRGADGWPEGEEPRLRCTFCRRTYAGVNARSMWRRHVYEKHKIAMSNRRDGGDKPRGRRSSKENGIFPANGPGKVLDMDLVVTDEGAASDLSYRSTFRSGPPTRRCSFSTPHQILSSHEAGNDDLSSDDAQPPSYMFSSTLSSANLPPSPPSPLLVDSDTSFETVTSLASPLPNLPIVPPSPYNPLQTPAFKHVPPRLPSDQPWRFPSPSHPMHTNRELCLSMLARDDGSPIVKASPSLSSGDLQHKTPFCSPFVRIHGDTPDSMTKVYRPSPKGFSGSDKVARFPFANRLRLRYEVDVSPLCRSSKLGRHRSSPGPPSDDWPSDPLVLEPVASVHDPFTETWVSRQGEIILEDRSTPPSTSPEADSPVVRKHTGPKAEGDRPTIAGLGFGLLEPFKLPDEAVPPIDDSDFDTEHDQYCEEDNGRDVPLDSSPSAVVASFTKRRKTIEM